jgi:hypothetical protein
MSVYRVHGLFCIPCDNHTMSESKSAVHSRVDAEAAARFLTEHAGIPVSSRTVLAWARLGRIPCLRLVGRVAFSLAELEAWVSAGHVVPELPTPYASNSAQAADL